MHRQAGLGDMEISSCLQRIGATNSVVGTRSNSVHFSMCFQNRHHLKTAFEGNIEELTVSPGSRDKNSQ